MRSEVDNLMPVYTGYFSTLQSNNNPDGFWNISHASTKYMIARFGMKWTDLRRHMVAAFISEQRDPDIIETVKQKTHQFIPLRTGHLMDAIFKSMRMTRNSWYNSHFFANFSYEWPLDRPIFIKGRVKHTPPDKGYGDWGTVGLTEPIPISRVSVEHVTANGNALYNLNDPQAQANIPPELEKVIEKEIRDDFEQMFSHVLITLHIGGGTIVRGVVGQTTFTLTRPIPYTPPAKVAVFNQ